MRRLSDILKGHLDVSEANLHFEAHLLRILPTHKCHPTFSFSFLFLNKKIKEVNFCLVASSVSWKKYRKAKVPQSPGENKYFRVWWTWVT